MSNFWNAYKTRVYSNCTSAESSRTSVQFWKDRMFASAVVYFIPLCLLALFPSVYLSIIMDVPGLLISDFITVGIILGVAFLPGISVHARKILFNGALFFISVVLFYYLGYDGPGMLYLLSVTIFVVLSMDKIYGYIVLILNTLICVIFGLFIHFELLDNILSTRYQLDVWVGVSTNLIFLSGIAVFLIPHLFKGLQTSFDEQTNLSDQLLQSLSEKETLLAEIHHRVKNNLAVVTSLMELQAMKTEDRELQDRLRTAQRRIQTIASIHELLYNSESLSYIDFGENIKLLHDSIKSMYSGGKHITTSIDVDLVPLDIHQAIPCALIVNEVITNVYKHAFSNNEQGNLEIRVYEFEKKVHIEINDNGEGLPDNFMAKSSSSIGMTIIHSLNDQIDGTMKFDNQNGTQFKLVFKKTEIPLKEHFSNP